MTWISQSALVDGLLRDDGDLQRRLDVGVEPHGDLGGTELLQRLLELEATAVDLDTELRLDRVRDVGRGDRTEELAALTCAGLDLDRAAGQTGGQCLGVAPR